MNKTRKWLWILGLGLCLLLPLAYFYKENFVPEPLRIVINEWPGYEYLMLAKEKGFFEEEGLDVEFLKVNSLTEVRRAFEKGQANGMASTIIEVLEANVNSGRVPKVVLVTSLSQGADVIVAHAEIKKPRDLVGKKVAVELNSLGMYMLVRFLQTHSMRIADINMVPLSQIQMREAVKKKHVVAAVTYPPASLDLLQLEGVHPIFSSADIKGEVIDVLSIDAKLLKKMGVKKASRLLSVWNKVIHYVKEHPEEARVILASRSRLSKEMLEDVLSKLHIFTAEEQALLFEPQGNLEKGLDLARSLILSKGMLKKALHSREYMASEVVEAY